MTTPNLPTSQQLSSHSQDHPPELHEVFITELAGEYEGICLINNEKIYVPYALKGEKILGEIYFRRGKQKALKIVKILEPSSERIEPFCPKFTLCGGCSLQHIQEQNYRKLKTKQLQKALVDLEIPYEASFSYWGKQHERRRLSLSYKKFKDSLLLGFFRHRSSSIEHIDSCPLITDTLNALIEPLRAFLTTICQNRQSGFVHLTQLDNTIDLSWSPARFKSKDLTPDLICQWNNFAATHKIGRVTRAGKDLIGSRLSPELHWLEKPIHFPPASFLQPSVPSERYMIQKMLEYIKQINFEPKAFYDLFCGLGTFSLPLLEVKGKKPLKSFDCDGPAHKILKEYAKGRKNWEVEQRDLFSDPYHDFLPESLVVLDPPRAGARDQIQALIQSTGKMALVMISCDEQTMARDIARLTQENFELIELTGIDQFPWTTHIESMAFLQRKTR